MGGPIGPNMAQLGIPVSLHPQIARLGDPMNWLRGLNTMHDLEEKTTLPWHERREVPFTHGAH